MIVALHVNTEPGDTLDLDTATRNLRRDLLSLELDDVTLARTEAPDGARGDAITLGVLILAFANSTVLVAVCQVLRAWVLRGQGRSVTLRSGSKTLEITGPTTAQNQQLIDAFVKIISESEQPSKGHRQ